MKIVIDIDDEQVLFDIKNRGLEGETETDKVIINALYSGTPLPDNATNGDVIKALFPDAENIRVDNGLPLNFVLEFELHRNYKNWWNSPYKEGDTDGNS